MLEPPARPTSSLAPPLRRMLLAVAALLAVAGVPTFVLATRTDDLFAWTIEPPLTAAFMGAGYWATALLAVLAARSPTWSGARVALPGALVFSVLTMVATLLHFDRFHEGRPITWAWVAIYAVVPVMLALFALGQLRGAGADPPRAVPLPLWAQLAAGAQALAFFSLGAALFAAPEWADAVWPWPLSPLTGRIVGAWLVGLGVGAAHGLLERDWERIRPAVAASAAFGALQLVSLARFGETPDWGAAPAWVYAAANAGLVAFGAVGLLAPRAAGPYPAGPEPPH